MRVKTLVKEFRRLLNHYDLKKSEIFIVPNVKEWAESKGISEDNPFRLGLGAKRSNSNIWDIVLKEDIKRGDIEGVLSAMFYHGFEHINELRKLRHFVLHLFLHEIAHAKGVREELEADNWAYKELGNTLKQ